ncbi:MAG: APC family permease [Thiotrichales bacterium]
MSDRLPLRRTLTTTAVVFSGVGVILGAGIYALIGEAAATAGNAVWLAFVFAALIAAFTGLSYAELASMFPRAGAEYEYTDQAFGRGLAFVVGALVVLSAIVGAATVALGFAGYLHGYVALPRPALAAMLLVALALLIASGIRNSTAVIVILTVIQAAGLVGIIVIGLPYLGSVDYFEMPHGLGGVIQAAALIFFAYQGFEDVVKLSEETVQPERAIPRGLILALITTTLLYVLVALAAVSVGGAALLAGADAPFAVIVERVAGARTGLIFTFIALVATASTVLVMLLAASRLIYGMARAGSLPERLAWVSARTRTPTIALLLVTAAALLFLMVGTLRDVALLANFTLYVTFTIINAAVIGLRFRLPDRPRPFRIRGAVGRVPIVPVLGIATCVFFMWQIDRAAWMIGGGLIVLIFGIHGLMVTRRRYG